MRIFTCFTVTVILFVLFGLTVFSNSSGIIDFAAGESNISGVWSHSETDSSTSVEYIKSRTGVTSVYIQGLMTSLEKEYRNNYCFEYILREEEQFQFSDLNNFKIELKKDNVYLDSSVYTFEMRVKFYLSNNETVELSHVGNQKLPFEFTADKTVVGTVTKIHIYPIYEVYDKNGNIKDSPPMTNNNVLQTQMPISFRFIDENSNVNLIDNIPDKPLTSSTSYSGTGIIDGLAKYSVKLADAPLVNVSDVSMLFDSGINFKAYLQVDSSLIESDYSVFVDGELKEVIKDGSNTYILCKVPPKDLENKVFNLKIITPSSEIETFINTSEYIETVSEYSEELFNLMNSVKSYASCAKAYFDKAVEVTEVSSVNDEKIKLLSVKENTGSFPNGIKIVSSSLILENNIKVRHYFEVEDGYSADDFAFTYSGRKLTPISKDGYYCLDIEDVYVTDLETPLVLNVSSETSDTDADIIYSVGSYMSYCVLHSDDEALVNLIRSLYLYYEAAVNYSEC